MDRKIGDRRERAKVRLLTLARVRISGPDLHASGEVLDPHDVAVAAEHPLAQRADVEPPLCGILQAAVVEIEAIDIDDGAQSVRRSASHSAPSLNAQSERIVGRKPQRRPARAKQSALRFRRQGRDVFTRPPASPSASAGTASPPVYVGRGFRFVGAVVAFALAVE